VNNDAQNNQVNNDTQNNYIAYLFHDDLPMKVMTLTKLSILKILKILMRKKPFIIFENKFP